MRTRVAAYWSSCRAPDGHYWRVARVEIGVEVEVRFWRSNAAPNNGNGAHLRQRVRSGGYCVRAPLTVRASVREPVRAAFETGTAVESRVEGSLGLIATRSRKRDLELRHTQLA